MLTMEELMLGAVERNASDIHLKTDNPPIYRIDGELKRLEEKPLTDDDLAELLRSITEPADMAKFEKIMELDSSYVMDGIARFRVNACKDDGDTRIVLRLIPLKFSP